MNLDLVGVACFSAQTIIYGGRAYRRTAEFPDLIVIACATVGFLCAVIRMVGP